MSMSVNKEVLGVQRMQPALTHMAHTNAPAKLVFLEMALPVKVSVLGVQLPWKTEVNSNYFYYGHITLQLQYTPLLSFQIILVTLNKENSCIVINCIL